MASEIVFFWEHVVPVDQLKTSRGGLRKIGYKDENISMSNIIKWENFKIQSFSTKPPKELFTFNMTWEAFCKLLIEIGFNILGLNPETYADVVSDDNLADIERSNTLSRVLNEQNKLLQPVFKKVATFSDIKDESVFQLIEAIPCQNDSTRFRANISDGESWVSTLLDKV